MSNKEKFIKGPPNGGPNDFDKINREVRSALGKRLELVDVIEIMSNGGFKYSVPEVREQDWNVAALGVQGRSKTHMDLLRERRSKVDNLKAANNLFYNELIDYCSDELKILIFADGEFMERAAVEAIEPVGDAPGIDAAPAIANCETARDGSRLYLIMRRLCMKGDAVEDDGSAVNAELIAYETFSKVKQRV